MKCIRHFEHSKTISHLFIWLIAFSLKRTFWCEIIRSDCKLENLVPSHSPTCKIFLYIHTHICVCVSVILLFNSSRLSLDHSFPTWMWDIEIPDLEEGSKGENKERKQAGRLADNTQERSFHKLRHHCAELRFKPFLHIEANASD